MNDSPTRSPAQSAIRSAAYGSACRRQWFSPPHRTLLALDVRKVRDLASLSFIGAKSNIALLGPPGVDKTMIAVAACQTGYSIYFTSLHDLGDVLAGDGQTEPVELAEPV